MSGALMRPEPDEAREAFKARLKAALRAADILKKEEDDERRDEA